MNQCAPCPRQQTASWSLVFLAQATYIIGFLVFYPGAMIVSDETYYIAQANAFAHGHLYETVSVPFNLQKQQTLASTYPPGTSLLQAPFVRLAGWRAARFLSLLSLATTVVLLARWLQRSDRPIWFSLVFLLYPPVLVLGRVGMSDLPSAIVVLMAIYLFWTGEDHPWLWFSASAIAGASLLFRESNVLVFLPLFGFAILKRERGWPHLIAGTIAGVTLRLIVTHVVFGNALFIPDTSAGFSLGAVPRNLSLYLVALLIMVPGGLALSFAYRGKRRWAVVTAIALHFAFYLAYNYNASESGRAKQLILAPRFFVPLIPLMIFAMADTAVRLWEKWSKNKLLGSPAMQRGVAGVFAFTLLSASFLVHPVMARFSRSQWSISQAIYGSTSESAPVLTNPIETWKFVSSVYGSRMLIDYNAIPVEHLDRLRQTNGPTYLVLLQRTDSDFYEAATLNDERFLRRIQRNCALRNVHDQWHDSHDRLRIWEVGESCFSHAAAILLFACSSNPPFRFFTVTRQSILFERSRI